MLHLRTSDLRMAAGHFATACEEDEMSTAALSDVDVRVREHVVHQLDWDPFGFFREACSADERKTV